MAKLTLAELANLQNEATAVSAINNNSALIETAIENTLSRDGTSPNSMDASIDMNSNRILNLPEPIAATEPLRLQELSDFTGGGSITLNAIPAGGTTDQVLTKDSGSDYDVSWQTPDTTTVVVMPQGRLTLTTGVAVTGSDVSGATTIYYTPVTGRFVPIYNGTDFVSTDTGGELSQTTADATKSPAAVGASSVYDLFVWNDSGTIRCTRGPAWSSDTSRGSGAGTSEVTQVEGIWLNANSVTNGPAAQRGTLVGSVRSNSSSQLVDSLAFRWVSNIYNAVMRPMKVIESTSTWNYTTATFRQANANAANQLDLLQSLAGGLMKATVSTTYKNTTASQFGVLGIDVDTLNTTTIVDNITLVPTVSVTGELVGVSAFYTGYPGLGRHVAIWKEYSSAAGTGTFYGDGGGAVIQGGIFGEIPN